MFKFMRNKSADKQKKHVEPSDETPVIEDSYPVDTLGENTTEPQPGNVLEDDAPTDDQSDDLNEAPAEYVSGYESEYEDDNASDVFDAESDRMITDDEADSLHEIDEQEDNRSDDDQTLLDELSTTLDEDSDDLVADYHEDEDVENEDIPEGTEHEDNDSVSDVATEDSVFGEDTIDVDEAPVDEEPEVADYEAPVDEEPGVEVQPSKFSWFPNIAPLSDESIKEIEEFHASRAEKFNEAPAEEFEDDTVDGDDTAVFAIGGDEEPRVDTDTQEHENAPESANESVFDGVDAEAETVAIFREDNSHEDNVDDYADNNPYDLDDADHEDEPREYEQLEGEQTEEYDDADTSMSLDDLVEQVEDKIEEDVDVETGNAVDSTQDDAPQDTIHRFAAPENENNGEPVEPVDKIITDDDTTEEAPAGIEENAEPEHENVDEFTEDDSDDDYSLIDDIDSDLEEAHSAQSDPEIVDDVEEEPELEDYVEDSGQDDAEPEHENVDEFTEDDDSILDDISDELDQAHDAEIEQDEQDAIGDEIPASEEQVATMVASAEGADVDAENHDAEDNAVDSEEEDAVEASAIKTEPAVHHAIIAVSQDSEQIKNTLSEYLDNARVYLVDMSDERNGLHRYIPRDAVLSFVDMPEQENATYVDARAIIDHAASTGNTSYIVLTGADDIIGKMNYNFPVGSVGYGLVKDYCQEIIDRAMSENVGIIVVAREMIPELSTFIDAINCEKKNIVE